MDITSKTTLVLIIGLIAITVGLSGSAGGRGLVTPSAAIGVVDCNVHDPFSECYDLDRGYPAHDLFITGNF
jgi:hypothetical protein